MQMKTMKFNFLAGIALLTISSIPVEASAQGINRDRSGGAISSPTYQIAQRYNRNNRRYNNSNNRRRIEDRISEYYQEILGRYPDSNGLRTYTDAVQDGRMSLEQVRHELINSQEARNRGYNNNNYNRSGYNNRNNRGQIEAEISRYYQEILGRNPDSNGLKNYADAVQDRRMSLEQVRRELINSPEGRSRSSNRNNYNRHGYSNNRGQIEAEISRYYQEILGRNPDSNGLKNFADAVQDRRMSLEQVRNELINSPEGRARNR
jgi:uncharacterized protein YbcI